MHRAICGLDPATELDMLGVFRELYCGEVIFEEEAAHDLPYPSSIVAGENSCDLIFIDSATYQALAMPFAPQTPDPWISVGISLEKHRGQRSAEDITKIAESIGSVPGFGHLDPKLLQDLANHVKIRRLPQESLIVQYGEKSDTIFLLLQGTVSIHEPPRGERRRCFGNAGQSSTVGICNRIGCPGEEPFGLTSMINSCENLCTIACRSSCLFYTLRHADMEADLFSRFYSACRKIIRKPAYMKQPREDRKDHQILNIINYMKENPFFSNLDFAALSRLAVSIESIELSKGEEVAGIFTYRGSQSLAIINKGSVSTCSSRKNVRKVKFIRCHPFRPDQSRVTTALGPTATSAKPTSRGDVSDDSAQDIAFSRIASSEANVSGPLQAANAFSRRSSVVSSAVALGRMNKRQSFSRLSSSKSQRWSVAFAGSAMLDLMEHDHSKSDDFELVEHLVASYGQGFWTGLLTCFANEDDSEVFLVSKSEWRKILNSISMFDVSEVSSLLNSHPCFQGLKSSEIQNFLQYSKHVQLKEGTVLFHSGDTLSDVFFLKEGSIQLRTNNIFLDRDPMSTVEKLHIPSSVVASVVDTDAIINDIINLTDDTPVEVLEKWMEHRESYTALAASKTTLVAISKVALLTLNAEKRTQLLLKKQTLDSFHLSRCRVLENAHEGLLRGQQIVPWKHPVPKQQRQQNDIINELQHKKFAHKQPPIHRPPWAKHVTETVDTHGYLKALVSPRFKGVQLPRMQYHPKPDAELFSGSNTAPRSPRNRSATYSSTNQKTETAHKLSPESSRDDPEKPRPSTFGFHEVTIARFCAPRAYAQ
jgi:CRP-like cAMP-binding protein